MDKIELLKSRLTDKIAEIDKRIQKYEKDVLIDHSSDRARLHCQARGYERVLKMIDELPDPIPIPTIKPEDIIFDLLFASINRDLDFPHDFEVKAFENAVNYLKENQPQFKYDPKLFDGYLKQMREVVE